MSDHCHSSGITFSDHERMDNEQTTPLKGYANWTQEKQVVGRDTPPFSPHRKLDSNTWMSETSFAKIFSGFHIHWSTLSGAIYISWWAWLEVKAGSLCETCLCFWIRTGVLYMVITHAASEASEWQSWRDSLSAFPLITTFKCESDLSWTVQSTGPSPAILSNTTTYHPEFLFNWHCLWALSWSRRASPELVS